MGVNYCGEKEEGDPRQEEDRRKNIHRCKTHGSANLDCG